MMQQRARWRSISSKTAKTLLGVGLRYTQQTYPCSAQGVWFIGRKTSDHGNWLEWFAFALPKTSHNLRIQPGAKVLIP